MDAYLENLELEAKLKPLQKDVRIFESKEISLILTLLEPYNSLESIENEVLKFKELLKSEIEKFQNLIPNKKYINRFNDILDNLTTQFSLLSEKMHLEKELRLTFLTYFNFNVGNQNQSELVVSILKNILSFSNKMNNYIKELPVSLNTEKFYQKDQSSIPLRKSSNTENFKAKAAISQKSLVDKYKLK